MVSSSSSSCEKGCCSNGGGGGGDSPSSKGNKKGGLSTSRSFESLGSVAAATSTTTGALFSSSTHSIISVVSAASTTAPSNNKKKKVKGTSNVLSMLPVGKSCCAENQCSSSGGNGAGRGASNSKRMMPTTPMNTNTETSNVLIQYTLQDLDRRVESNFLLGLICLGVCAVNCVLFYLNWAMHNTDPKPEVSHRTYHLLEFWTSCVYSVAETFALVMSPKTMVHIYNKPNLLKLLLFFNVVNSAIPALLMTLDFEYFEVLSHELEFINSFTLSFITMILVASLLNPPAPAAAPPSMDDEENWDVDYSTRRLSLPPLPSYNPQQQQQQQQRSSQNTTYLPINDDDSDVDDDDKASILMGIVACGVAVTNFVVYNAGYHGVAHYLEFSFNIIVSLITFWFCMDNRFMAQMEISQILYGRHNNCIFCQQMPTTNNHEKQELPNSSSSSTAEYGEEDDDNNNNNNNKEDEEMQLPVNETTPLVA